MIPWRVTLSGVDITSVVSSVRVSFAAGSICGECDIQLADRAVLAGVVVPRVPRRPSMGVEVLHGGVWETRGMFFLERISRPQDISSRTAAIWGRSVSARLGEPWGPKISRQWDAETSIAAIVAELSALTGATIAVTKDYPVCAYCYAVTEQTPAQILRDLATKSGQELWPQPDGSVRVAPRLYRDLPAPAHTFPAADIVMRRRDRIAPDFGNRVLISGDGAVAGLSVTVVPMYAGEECVAANGKDQVRLLAVVLDREGRFVAPGTQVGWSAPAGTLALASSPTGPAEIVGETQRAQSYTRLSLNLPASAVIGVYAYSDHHRRRNLYLERRGSVDGRVITFAQPLDFFDQAVLVDYEVLGATNIWTAGYEPGDVTVTAAVAGAQGSAVIHQSNPTACSSSIVLESSPDKICIGEKATILAKVKMFAGAGSGMIEFDLRGCGRLSSRRKLLTVTPVTEKLRTTTWGGVSQVRLGAVPSGAISVVIESDPGVNLYASHQGQVINLSRLMDSGTEVLVTYNAGGTAMVSWIPEGKTTGQIMVREELPVTQVDPPGGGPQRPGVVLSHPPAEIVMITASSTYIVGPNLAGEINGNSVLLSAPQPSGTQLYCTYWTAQPLQPDCKAVIIARVRDGSQDGGTASIDVTAVDCRAQGGDPALPPEDTSPDDPVKPPKPDDDGHGPVNPIGCEDRDIQARITDVSGDKWGAVSGVSSVTDCPGLCTCDEICAALRSNGTLGKAGKFYSECVAKCTQGRADTCTPCNLTGPAVLEPGAEGIWMDDKGNTGEPGGDLEFIGKSAAGYKFRMPPGGQGPFTVRACYGSEYKSICCEAKVDFPPCDLSGPSMAEWDTDLTYTSPIDLTAATITGNLRIVAVAGNTVIAQLPSGQCSGWIAVSTGGKFCGMVNVGWVNAGKTGLVAGPAYLDAGETGVYSHGLGATETQYTGSLEIVSTIPGGAILRMPPSAAGSETYTAAWSGPCGSSAQLQVSLLYDETGRCLAPSEGCGCPPAAGSIVSNGYDPSDKSCYRVLDRRWSETSSGWMPDYCDRPTGAWRCYGLQIWSLGDGQCGQDYGYLYVATERINK